ncbi:MAG TPA: SDR family NAD(P)-dependent oxidoreductase [Thermoanaerobaculia bacterium]|jgi:3-oxoacyl-[acyl-carrier protein] reductase|nr:SDR family NAD(P)-dependent oxidoreductase [Thermoanaerobaculia bacterium]
MLEDFTGRVALVTGAFRGFGFSTAERLASRGASVAVHVRDSARAETAARRLGDRGFAVSGDLESPAELPSIVGRALDRFGRLDILVNNAAVALSTRFESITEEEWRRTFEVNVTAAFLLIRAAVPAMREQRYGRIVNLSSTAGKTVSTLGGAHYTASKAALLGLTRAAAKELGPYGITVNAVCPGLFDTELTREHATAEQLEAIAKTFPVRRLGDPGEVADLICFLASEAAGYITGASLDINGGDLMV